MATWWHGKDAIASYAGLTLRRAHRLPLASTGSVDQITLLKNNVVNNIVTIHAFIGSNPVGHIETEIRYQAIDAAAREKLESLNILKHPFKIPFRAIDAESNK